MPGRPSVHRSPRRSLSGLSSSAPSAALQGLYPATDARPETSPICPIFPQTASFHRVTSVSLDIIHFLHLFGIIVQGENYALGFETPRGPTELA